MHSRGRQLRLGQLGAALGGLLISSLAAAAFITDNIELEVFSQPFNQGAILTTVHSGDEVQVLSSDGDYARITTATNVTGWIEARFLSDLTNARAELAASQEQVSRLENELRTARDKLAATSASTVNSEDMKKLQQAVKDVGWLRAELNKSRERVKELEATAKTRAASTTSAQAELEKLRADNADLQQRLGAVLLINGEPEDEPATAEMIASEDPETTLSNTLNAIIGENDGWRIRLHWQWFLGSLVSAIIIGIILGMMWFDRRLRKRHGGFRLY